jgi:hypothetical protein
MRWLVDEPTEFHARGERGSDLASMLGDYFRARGDRDHRPAGSLMAASGLSSCAGRRSGTRTGAGGVCGGTSRSGSGEPSGERRSTRWSNRSSRLFGARGAQADVCLSGQTFAGLQRGHRARPRLLLHGLACHSCAHLRHRHQTAWFEYAARVRGSTSTLRVGCSSNARSGRLTAIERWGATTLKRVRIASPACRRPQSGHPRPRDRLSGVARHS